MQLRLGRIELDLLVVFVLDRHLVDQRLEFFHRQVPATHTQSVDASDTSLLNITTGGATQKF